MFIVRLFLGIAIISSIFSLILSRVVVPQQMVSELIDRAYIESMAQKQRDLLDNDEDEVSDQDPEVMPGFYQGDMAGVYYSEDLGRVGINFEQFPARKWLNNTVHYMISPLYLPQEHQILTTAIGILGFFTCLEFKEWDGEAPDYLIIWPVSKPNGCWSYVGRLGGPQIVSLQAPDKKSPQCFAGIGRPLHEIMHALGVYHEQSRPDRDQYISVVQNNVNKGYINNFDKLAAKNVSLPFEYDYNSIMHYGGNFFSKNRKKPTLIPKEKGVKIGQRINLSQLDCLKLNSMYGCLRESDPFKKRKYTAICDFLGLESTLPNLKRKKGQNKPTKPPSTKTNTTSSTSTTKPKPTTTKPITKPSTNTKPSTTSTSKPKMKVTSSSPLPPALKTPTSPPPPPSPSPKKVLLSHPPQYLMYLRTFKK